VTENRCSRVVQGRRCRLHQGHGGDCYVSPRNLGQEPHALDGTRTPDVEDFEDRIAVVMEGCRVDDRRQAERIVLDQRLEQSRAKQQRRAGAGR